MAQQKTIWESLFGHGFPIVRTASDGTWDKLDGVTTSPANTANPSGTDTGGGGTGTTSTTGTTATSTGTTSTTGTAIPANTTGGTASTGDVTPTLVDKAASVFTQARASKWFWPVVILVVIYAFMGKIKIKV